MKQKPKLSCAVDKNIHLASVFTPYTTCSPTTRAEEDGVHHYLNYRLLNDDGKRVAAEIAKYSDPMNIVQEIGEF